MMPGIDSPEDPSPLDPRKKRAQRAIGVSAILLVLATALIGVRFDWWQWVGCGYVSVMTCAAVIFVQGDGFRPRDRDRDRDRGRGTGGGFNWRGRDDDRPAGVSASRWHLLVMVSRMMPPSAGRRWLAEAESLLSEIEAVRRGAAIRSYLLSVPLLVAAMWAREVQQLVRLGPRRPG
jgi:hypothetical protein